jgi:hypothetical protein
MAIAKPSLVTSRRWFFAMAAIFSATAEEDATTDVDITYLFIYLFV